MEILETEEGTKSVICQFSQDSAVPCASFSLNISKGVFPVSNISIKKTYFTDYRDRVCVPLVIQILVTF